MTYRVYVIIYSCFFFILFWSEKGIPPILLSDFEFLVRKFIHPFSLSDLECIIVIIIRVPFFCICNLKYQLWYHQTSFVLYMCLSITVQSSVWVKSHIFVESKYVTKSKLLIISTMNCQMLSRRLIYDRYVKYLSWVLIDDKT